MGLIEKFNIYFTKWETGLNKLLRVFISFIFHYNKQMTLAFSNPQLSLFNQSHKVYDKNNALEFFLTIVSEEKVESYRSADYLMQKFTSKDAIKKMIHEGGYETMLNALVEKLENELVSDQKKQIKP